MEDFNPIYENENDTFCSYFVCIHCNSRVERGIVNISNHWMNCLERKDGLIRARNSFESQILDSWSINKK